MNDVFKKRLAALNDEQRAAVMHGEGPLLVVAGPGSGKTEMLALRVARILSDGDVRPREVLCLTFTDSAAGNMRSRLTDLVGGVAWRVPVHTFHSFAGAVMAEYPEYFYGGAVFSAADELTQIEVMDSVFADMAHDNPLRSEHPEQGFVYLRAARGAIAQLKKAGLAPDDFSVALTTNAQGIAYANARIGIFDERMGMKVVPRVHEYAAYLRAWAESGPSEYASFPVALADSLDVALEKTDETGKATSLSAWKEKWTRKNDAGVRIVRDGAYEAKLVALADAYREYRARMFARGLYDFDDMLLDVLVAVRAHPALRHALQEKYAYVLVDEFQDTNDAQMRLAGLLSENIMAVGDDDQAVYRFQGAEISNILDFTQRFPGCCIVNLTRNYRSREEILGAARAVITQGEDRLERRLEGLSKELIASGADATGGSVMYISFATPAHEGLWVAHEIRRMIADGADPDGVAVIGRRHADLDVVRAQCAREGVPVAYERERNVLLEPHIRAVIAILRFAVTAGDGNGRDADELLPEILSYPFWLVPRGTMWEISHRAAMGRQPWLAVMKGHEDPAVRALCASLFDVALKAKTESAEQVIDAVVALMRPWYWGEEKLRENPEEYLSFLSALQAFVRAVRAHKPGQFLAAADCVAFVDLHEKNGVPINDRSRLLAARKAVHVLTAHKAKGLEFDTVFVVGCQDSVWAGGQRGTLLPFPANMPLAPAGDGDDDHLRLLYVAMTRAKWVLHMTSYESTMTGKDSLRLRFLAHAPAIAASEPEGDVAVLFSPAPTPSGITVSEKDLLEGYVAEYRLSVTHLNNFLNVATAGPRVFFEQNLLRFPQAKSATASYGSAMHKAAELLQAGLARTVTLPAPEEFVGFFTAALKRERLSPVDRKLYMKRGEATLRAFYTARSGSFSVSDRSEMRFGDQDVTVAGAPLTGAIDRIVFDGESVAVAHDYKTGKPLTDWEGTGSAHEAVKAHNYKRQLLFYKLLIDNAHDFIGRRVMNAGVLEFMEPRRDGMVAELRLDIREADMERLKLLIEAVYLKIRALDFPDIAKYPKDLRGIIAFEDDLLAGSV